MSFPEYLYKIVTECPPSELPHRLPLSELDRKDGFIHLSDGNQTPVTADLYFSFSSTLYVLKVSSRAVLAPEENADLRWAEGSPGCVHIHGKSGGEMPRLGEGIVVDVVKFEKRNGDDWKKAMAGVNCSVVGSTSSSSLGTNVPFFVDTYDAQ